MIPIQIILITGFVVLLAKFIISPNSYQIKAWTKMAGIFFVGFAVLSILLPGVLNKVAHMLGVGRGADLLLYLLTLTFIFVIFSQYVNTTRERRRFVKVVRKLALIEAELHATYDKKH